MRMPNLSSAAVAISTIDSESTSRSSRKVFSGVTSPTGTPAISFTIWASSARISCCDMRSPCSVLRGSGDADDLSGVGETGAEGEEQGETAAFHLAGADQARQREWHRG